VLVLRFISEQRAVEENLGSNFLSHWIVNVAVDCVVSDWVNQGVCNATCGSGSLAQQRLVRVPASYGGVACPTDLTRVIACSKPPCQADCQSTWAEWGACSATCGVGQRARALAITRLASGAGIPCPTVRVDVEVCQVEACPDCTLTTGPWGQPSCLNGGICVDGTPYDSMTTCNCINGAQGQRCQDCKLPLRSGLQ
jgi:hypothetical protein